MGRRSSPAVISMPCSMSMGSTRVRCPWTSWSRSTVTVQEPAWRSQGNPMLEYPDHEGRR